MTQCHVLPLKITYFDDHGNLYWSVLQTILVLRPNGFLICDLSYKPSLLELKCEIEHLRAFRTKQDKMERLGEEHEKKTAREEAG